MSSHEPELDDEDTGPFHLDSVRGHPVDARERRFHTPLPMNSGPAQQDRRPLILVAAATAAVVGVGVIAWLFLPSSDDSQALGGFSIPTIESGRPREAEVRLMGMLPLGYDAEACRVMVPAKGALAQVSCEKNTDPGGPLTATYILEKDDESLRAVFDNVVGSSSVVECPGSIQSPGPWRRDATPQQVRGTLVCGFQQSKPTVAWTTDSELMVSVVQSGPQGPNMVQLYTWWASHS